MNTIKKSIIIAFASLMSVSAFAQGTGPVYAKFYQAGNTTPTTGWYETIASAMASTITRDSLSIVLYGNVTETSVINIVDNQYVSIRSAAAGTADAGVTGAPSIATDGYTVTFNSSSTNVTWLTTQENSHLFIGRNFHYYQDGTGTAVYTESGPLTFDVSKKGRFLSAEGHTRIEGSVTIKNARLTGEENYGAGIYNSTTNLFIDGGVAFINNVNVDSYGGAIYSSYDTVLGTCTFKDNSARLGSAIYMQKDRSENSMIRLQSSPRMLTDRDIIYLSEGAYFQKANTINDDACLYVEIPVQSQTVGHDVAKSHPVTTYKNGPILPEDLDNFHMINLDNTLELVYTEHDSDTGRSVLELQKRHVDLTISKSGMSAGESALFNVKDVGNNVIFHNVAVTAGASGTGSVTISGIEVGVYTVEEIQAWSWAYTPALTSLRQDISSEPTFVFKNEAKSTTPAHGESYVNNEFSSSSSR